MIKRDITETVYEYDKEGKLIKKTIIETHEEENNTVTTYPSFTYLNGNTTGTQPYKTTLATTTTKCNCDTEYACNCKNTD